jgi:hypothetical protein
MLLIKNTNGVEAIPLNDADKNFTILYKKKQVRRYVIKNSLFDEFYRFGVTNNINFVWK